MKRKLAFVLGGGGAHGAFQVGALRALLEANIHPDMLVGTSIGALNSSLLAIYGVNLSGIDKLIKTWQDINTMDPLPTNFIWMGMRTLLGRPDNRAIEQLKTFFTAHGLSMDLRFRDIHEIELLMVTADLYSTDLVLYGTDPNQLVYEGVLGSAAIPPWIQPLKIEGRCLVDGGFVSNLPIEPAISQGATHIIALDLFDTGCVCQEIEGGTQYLNQIIQTSIKRQRVLELELAKILKISIHNILLLENIKTPIWDFTHTVEYIERGYTLTRQELQKMDIGIYGDGFIKRVIKFLNISG